LAGLLEGVGPNHCGLQVAPAILILAIGEANNRSRGT
jgi:hypothetical protein